MNAIIAVFVILGLFFSFVGVFGVARMRDFYCRIQAITCLITFGSLFFCVAAGIYAFEMHMPISVIFKLILFVLFLFASNAVSSHALVKAGYHMGLKPENGFVMDDMADDFRETQEFPELKGDRK